MLLYLRKQLRAVNDDTNGQSLILAAMVMFTLFLFMSLSINIGSFVSRKVNMQSAADATALSGAAWQARGMNLIAALNTFKTFYARHLELEIAQGAFWTALCSAIGWIPGAQQVCVIAAEQTADAGLESAYAPDANPTGTNAGIRNIQLVISDLKIPAEALGFTAFYAGTNLNDADLSIPFGGGLMFNFIPGWPRIGLEFPPVNAPGFYGNAATGLPSPVSVAYLSRNTYPDRVFVFAATFRSFRRSAPMLPTVFRQSSLISNGFLTLAQARPFVPPFVTRNNAILKPRYLRGGLYAFTSNKAMDWDTKLMPISVDNFIVGFIPFLGPLAGGALTDSLLVH